MSPSHDPLRSTFTPTPPGSRTISASSWIRFTTSSHAPKRPHDAFYASQLCADQGKISGFDAPRLEYSGLGTETPVGSRTRGYMPCGREEDAKPDAGLRIGGERIREKMTFAKERVKSGAGRRKSGLTEGFETETARKRKEEEMRMKYKKAFFSGELPEECFEEGDEEGTVTKRNRSYQLY